MLPGNLQRCTALPFLEKATWSQGTSDARLDAPEPAEIPVSCQSCCEPPDHLACLHRASMVRPPARFDSTCTRIISFSLAWPRQPCSEQQTLRTPAPGTNPLFPADLASNDASTTDLRFAQRLSEAAWASPEDALPYVRASAAHCAHFPVRLLTSCSSQHQSPRDSLAPLRLPEGAFLS